MYLADMCWQEAKEAFQNDKTVIIIPIGSTEQHGCVGPLGTDWMIPQEFSRRLDSLDKIGRASCRERVCQYV